MNKLFTIGIGLFIIIVFISNIYTDGWIKASVELFIMILIATSSIVLLNKYKWKFVKATQIVGFGGLFIWMIFGSILLKMEISSEILMVSLFLIIVSISSKGLLPKKKLKGKSLEERVKRDLKITSVTLRKKFPTDGIGGFVIPALPFISFINKNWKKKLDKEAIIHENVHLYYLQNGWILGVLAVSIVILAPLLMAFSFVKNYSGLVSIIIVIPLLVHFEYITFNKTNRIGDMLGISTRRWNRKLMLTYFMIYSIQITIIFFVIQGIKFIGELLGGLI